MKPPSATPPLPPSSQNVPPSSNSPSGTTPAIGGSPAAPTNPAPKWWLIPTVVVSGCAIVLFSVWVAQRSVQPPTVGPFPGANTTLPQSVAVPNPLPPGAVSPPGVAAVPVQPNVPATGPEIVVQVAGRVASPGLYRMPAGSRVNDAVMRAGGALPDGNPQALNLAAHVGDGERIEVPSINAPPVAPVQGRRASTAQNLEFLRNNPLNLNTATVAQLEALPGIGPNSAQQILTYRSSKGPFQRVDDLAQVDGIGVRTVESLRPFVTAY